MLHGIVMMGVRAVHTTSNMSLLFSFMETRPGEDVNGIGIRNQREVRREKAEWAGIRVKKMVECLG